MNYEYALNQCTHYLLDILDVPPGPLPARAQGHWDEVFKLASEQSIFDYLVAWMLEYWNDALPEELKHQLLMNHEWNKARNVIFTQEIVELAKIFREAGIPAMFLKGAAGLVRGLYPLGWRYMSDIDVMVPEEQIYDGHKLLNSIGYISKNEIREMYHHLGPYSNQTKFGSVELHLDPYQLNYHSRKKNVEFWQKACSMEILNEKVTVPSIDDHVWILFRTDFLTRVCVPRLADLIELHLLIDHEFDINFSLLQDRAREANIPNIILTPINLLQEYVNSDIQSHYGGQSKSGLFRWKEWSLKYRKKSRVADDRSYVIEKDLAALKYYTDNRFISKILFIQWIFHNNSYNYQVKILDRIGLLPFAMKLKRIVKSI